MSKQIITVLAFFCATSLSSQTQIPLDPQISEEKIEWFLLNETMESVRTTLGRPLVVADFGQDYQCWQYRFGDVEGHEFSHVLVFRRSDRTLISVTRNYEPERDVDILFPESESEVHSFSGEEKPSYSIRTRRLPGDRMLMAMGTSRAGQRTGQIVLMQVSELRFFYPWLVHKK